MNEQTRKYPKDFLSYIRSEIGSMEYRVSWGGRFACGFFVSSVLFHFELIVSIDNLVKVVEHNLNAYGWKEIELKDIQPGDIVVYLPNTVIGRKYDHIGFYMGEDVVISNSAQNRAPKKHHITYDGKRCIKTIFALL